MRVVKGTGAPVSTGLPSGDMPQAPCGEEHGELPPRQRVA